MDETDTQFKFAATGERLTGWAEEPSLQILKGDLEAALPSQQAHLARIKRWRDLLLVEGSAKPPERKGRSRLQPKLIRRQAEWRYPALSEPLNSSDKLFQVSAATWEDSDAARQNSLVLNWQFRTKLDRIWLVDNIVRAVVDEGTCILRLGWERQTKVETVLQPEYEFLPLTQPEELQAFQEALELRTRNPREFNEAMPPEIQAAMVYFDESGQPTMARQVGEVEVEEEKILENRPTVEVLDPANVFIDPSCGGVLDKALFVITSFETNKAELLKEGDRYQNLDRVNWESADPATESNHESRTPNDFSFKDASRKKVVAYEYWGFYDIHGDGELKPIVATWIGDTLIRMEENPFPDQKLPFVVIPYLPVKRDLYGEPDAELLQDNQQTLGAIMRGMIDLLARSANSQLGFPKGMLDAINRRRFDDGEDYEFNPGMDAGKGIVEHKYPGFPMSALNMLQMQNQEAEALTGVKAFSGGLSGEAYGQVATAIRGMLDAASKREMSILRRVAKGVSEVGRKIIAMNAEFLSDTETIRVTNEEYVTVHREDLKGEFDLIVDISTFEVDNEKAQDLGFMLQTLGPNMDPQISMQILSQIAELKRMPALAEQLRNWRPQPDPLEEQLKQLEIQKANTELEKLQSEIFLNTARARAALADAGIKELDRIEQETGVAHAREVQKTQAQGRSNQHHEIIKALTRPHKEGERTPNIDAAVGYTALSDKLEEDALLGPQG